MQTNYLNNKQISFVNNALEISSRMTKSLEEISRISDELYSSFISFDETKGHANDASIVNFASLCEHESEFASDIDCKIMALSNISIQFEKDSLLVLKEDVNNLLKSVLEISKEVKVLASKVNCEIGAANEEEIDESIRMSEEDSMKEIENKEPSDY